MATTCQRCGIKLFGEEVFAGVCEHCKDSLTSRKDDRRITLAKFALGAVTVFLVNALLTWALAGTQAWFLVMAVAGIVLAFFLFGIFKFLLFNGGRIDGKTALHLLLLLLYAGILLISGFFIDSWSARTAVYVDNFSSQDVFLTLDGEKWLECHRQSMQLKSLRRGVYTLVVRAMSGNELDRQTIEVMGRGNYVLNVLGAKTYSRGRVDYGSFGFAPRGEQRIQSRWFKADVNYLFETPPQSIFVWTRRGQVGTSVPRSYLRRGEPTNPRPSPKAQ